MSRRRWQLRVEDILAAIEEIHTFVARMSFDEFRRDPKTLKAVMPDEIVSAHPEVPWPVMRGMRNALVHAYFNVDPKIVWDTIEQDLESLVAPLRSMLGSSE